ncbi:MAG: type secretion system protein [Candidatus Solibacter sp.]|nr:type secretion system protein [Candidatus Solibacter sp.]
MLPYFLIAGLTAVLTYSYLWARLERRDAALAVRRLAVAERQKSERGPRRPLLQNAGEARGRLTARLMECIKLRESAARLLETAALKWGPPGLLHRSLGLFLGVFAMVTLGLGNSLPLLALGAASAAAMLPVMYARRAAGKRVAAFEEQFPDCLEFISRSMRAGHAFSVALDMAHREFGEPLSSEFRRAFEEQKLGQPLDIVLRKLAIRMPSMDAQFFVSAVLMQKRTGGNLAELLDKLAVIIRERFKLRARIRTVSAQGLMSGRILSSIPVGVAALMFVMNPKYARFFVDDPVGHQLLAAGLGLQVVGYLIIRKIVTIET